MNLFDHHRLAAMALLNNAPLKSKEGSFLGQIAFSDEPLSPRQHHWLKVLLERHGLPPLREDAA